MTIKSVAKTFLTLIVALGVCLLAGYIGGYPALSRMPLGVIIDLPIGDYIGGYPNLIGVGMPIWYESLIKPVFSPPVWIFSPVWMVSFFLMGLTLFFILQSGTKQYEVRFGLILFCLQFLFTLLWAFAFFGLHSIFLASLCMIALWATLLCAIIHVSGFSVYGGMLLVPSFIWICWLAYLNYGIMVLNNLTYVI
jgi:tryptophan-rich sensory protein